MLLLLLRMLMGMMLSGTFANVLDPAAVLVAEVLEKEVWVGKLVASAITITCGSSRDPSWSPTTIIACDPNPLDELIEELPVAMHIRCCIELHYMTWRHQHAV